MTLRTTSLFISLAGLAAMLIGCASDQDPSKSNNDSNGPPNEEATTFESDNPGGAASSRNGGTLSADSSTKGGAVASGTVPTAAPAEGAASTEAARAIEEADIIKVENNRLYALSQYGGLNIIDISERDHMKLLGREKVMATPFEMYVRDSVVFALYNGYGEYLQGDKEGEWRYVQTSHVVVFDATNPKSPTVVGKFAVPGSISDSRIVGNVLYVVGFETNSCWNCQEGQHTTVVSLDISDPGAIRKIDQLSYADDTATQYSWQRSISVNSKRMYIAGPEYGANGPVGSTIQVVDISDPAGDLVEGAKVRAAGSVMSRWQMDEFDGHLRVVSQPGEWSFTDTARIQTYKVESASVVTQTANVAMTIPERETLRSVRFDGKRGYVITAEQKDPLFTLDLSNPEKPAQVGELEMPGWVYHMEPRGDRVVALGYDQGNPNGALAISLFDVADLAQPKLLDRVNFGGDWAWLAEDQDRIHKAFQVLDSANLILMPFSGWVNSPDNCGGTSRNGIQLVDWANDDLAIKGIATMVGQPRRGFLFDDRLFAVSDERVETFDITDRSSPQRKDSLKLVHNVQSTVVAGDTIVKFARDWYTNTLSIDTTTLAGVESPNALGHLDLAIGGNKCNGGADLGTVAAHGNRVYLVINQYEYDSMTSTSKTTARLVTLDVASPDSPKVIGDANLDFGEGWSYWYNGNLVNAGTQSVATENAFVVLSSKTDYTYTNNTSYSKTTSALHVLDVTKPNEPQATTLPVQGELGTTGLFASGNTVALGRYEASPTNAERVRFYVDRFDVKDASAPARLTSINVPGSLVAFDDEASNAVTIDYKSIDTPNITATDCTNTYPQAWFEYPPNTTVYNDTVKGICHAQQQTLFLVKLGNESAKPLGSKVLDIGVRVGTIATSEDRMFATLGQGYGYRYGIAAIGAADVAMCRGCGGYYYGWSTFNESKVPLLVLGGLRSGAFATGTLELSGGNYWSATPMVAAKNRALLSTGWQGKLAVVDATKPAAPTLVREAPVTGSVSSLSVASGIGIASLGMDGVQTIRMSD